MTFKAFQSSSWKVYLQLFHVCCAVIRSQPDTACLTFFFFSCFTASPSAAKPQFIQWGAFSLQCCGFKGIINVQKVLVLENWSHFSQNMPYHSWGLVYKVFWQGGFEGKDKTAIVDLVYMRPRFNVATLSNLPEEGDGFLQRRKFEPVGLTRWSR